MRAVRFATWQEEPALVEVATPVAGPGEVLIAVDAAGLCHSDLHIMEWPSGAVPWELPFTLGHENAGTVVALGPGTNGVAEGDRVLVHARWGCGRCWHCLQGAENRCPHSLELFGGQGGGAGRDGGLGCCCGRGGPRLSPAPPSARPPRVGAPPPGEAPRADPLPRHPAVPG